ncbi:hypothetical protein [Streptomyces sp. NPDC059708]|uniref:hypothetical protein n=1 Tax=Streptomyces sp. NPDC059708 TaxID=3346916 RepID=UPI00369D629F
MVRGPVSRWVGVFRWVTLLGLGMLAFAVWSSPAGESAAGTYDERVELHPVERRGGGGCLMRYTDPWEPERTRTAVFRCGAETASVAGRWPWRGRLYETADGTPFPAGAATALGVVGTIAAVGGVVLGCYRTFAR